MSLTTTHISVSDIAGGAARAAYRLHDGLRRIGHDSSMFVLKKKSDDPTVVTYQHPHTVLDRAARKWRELMLERDHAAYRATRPSGLSPFTDDRSPYGSAPVEQRPVSDVYNLHWVSEFLDLSAFFTQVRVPVVWTLHDTNAFTGGCHYTHGCDKFTRQCGACPHLGSKTENDLSRQIWQRKNAAYRRAASAGLLHVVTPSEWLATEARRSALFKDVPVSVIPYGLDTDVFTPSDPTGLRHALGIPAEGRIVLFVAASATAQRKGFTLLVDALEALDDVSGLHLVSIGSPKPSVQAEVPHIHLGRIEHERLMAALYSAADLFVIPSLEDNLPNTVLEALACATPVVGFDAGGIPDMVRPGETGLLAPKGDVRALRDAIARLLHDGDQRDTLSTRCRDVALSEYPLDLQARRYQDLYARLAGRAATEHALSAHHAPSAESLSGRPTETTT